MDKPSIENSDQERIQIGDFLARLRKNSLAMVVAGFAGIGGGSLASHGVATLGTSYTLGEYQFDADEKLKALENKLTTLQERKVGKSPGGLFKDWFKDVSKNPAAWIKNNAPALQARIKTERVRQEIGETLDWIVYTMLFALAWQSIVPRATKITYNILKNKEELKQKKKVAEAVNEHEQHLEHLMTQIVAYHKFFDALFKELDNNLDNPTITPERLQEIQTEMEKAHAIYLEWLEAIKL